MNQIYAKVSTFGQLIMYEKYSHLLFNPTDPPYLLFSFYSTYRNYIQRSKLDGSDRVTLFNSWGNRPRAIAYDYR